MGTISSHLVRFAAAAALIGLAVPAQATVVLDAEPNDSLATAQSLDGNFSLDADPDIESSTTIAHATVVNSGAGGYDWFSFTVGADNSLGIFDIDYGWAAPQYFDSFLDIYDASGARLIWDDDYEPYLTAGAGGSSSGLDSYLQYIFPTAGTYYVRVGGCCNYFNDGVEAYWPTGVPDYYYQGSDYTYPYELQVSLAAPGAVPEPATWAMMLLGFGAIGFSMRRRRSQTHLTQFAWS